MNLSFSKKVTFALIIGFLINGFVLYQYQVNSKKLKYQFDAIDQVERSLSESVQLIDSFDDINQQISNVDLSNSLTDENEKKFMQVIQTSMRLKQTVPHEYQGQYVHFLSDLQKFVKVGRDIRQYEAMRTSTNQTHNYLQWNLLNIDHWWGMAEKNISEGLEIDQNSPMVNFINNSAVLNIPDAELTKLFNDVQAHDFHHKQLKDSINSNISIEEKKKLLESSKHLINDSKQAVIKVFSYLALSIKSLK